MTSSWLNFWAQVKFLFVQSAFLSHTLPPLPFIHSGVFSSLDKYLCQSKSWKFVCSSKYSDFIYRLNSISRAADVKFFTSILNHAMATFNLKFQHECLPKVKVPTENRTSTSFHTHEHHFTPAFSVWSKQFSFAVSWLSCLF